MIFCECNADYQLLIFIGKKSREIGHSGDKGRVVSYLEKNDLGIGLVDEDPQSANPRNMKKYALVDKNGDLRKLSNKNKTLIVISPRLEDWYLNHARKHKINPIDFQLPKDPNILKDNPHYPSRKRFQEFQKTLYEAGEEFQILKHWLK